MININNLCKSYDDKEILSNISLDIREGDIHGLVGMSGAGKSTLLRTINGVEEFDSGNMRVMGKNIEDLNEKEMLKMRKNIGMIFQDFALMKRKTVYENIALPLRCWKYDNDYIDTKVKELVELVNMKDKLYNMPSNLSGGQRQRVAIARALALSPKILLSDESTSGLDPITTNNILDLLLDINEKLGITIVLVTHEMDVIKKVCDNVSILSDGHIVQTGKVEEIFSSFNGSSMMIAEKINLREDKGRVLLKVLEYSEDYNDKNNFLIKVKNIDYEIENIKIERLKHGKLGEYYISIGEKNLDMTKLYLDKIEGIKYKIIRGGELVEY